ncbi:hypothetical protein C8Q75DRAFT_331050 [Abortiporus biennis]|nr:hypothetical protein C8Q75DRAFT_331050 [Abortiporus biennis]
MRSMHHVGRFLRSVLFRIAPCANVNNCKIRMDAAHTHTTVSTSFHAVLNRWSHVSTQLIGPNLCSHPNLNTYIPPSFNSFNGNHHLPVWDLNTNLGYDGPVSP